MAKLCTPCLAPDVKAILLQAMEEQHPEIRKALSDIADCPDGRLVNLCASSRGTRVKRAPSAYNLHISSCMKAKNIKGFANAAPAMRECAAEWKASRAGG